MIATETTEDTEGKYSVLSVYSVAKNYTLYTTKNFPLLAFGLHVSKGRNIVVDVGGDPGKNCPRLRR